ncbi:hypothetical protein ACFLZP_05035, partial [Patescibacteria group bacterium]
LYVQYSLDSTDPVADTLEIPEALLFLIPLVLVLPKIIKQVRKRRKKHDRAYSLNGEEAPRLSEVSLLENFGKLKAGNS